MTEISLLVIRAGAAMRARIIDQGGKLPWPEDDNAWNDLAATVMSEVEDWLDEIGEHRARAFMGAVLR